MRKKCSAVAVVLFLGLSACSSTGLTKAEFVKKADAVCKATNEKFGALFDTDFPAVSEKIPAFFTKAAPIIRERASKLEAIGTVKGDQAKITELIGSARDSASAFGKAAKDPAAARKLFNEEGGKNEQKFRKASKSYGMKACAADPGDDEESAPKKLDPAKFSAEKKAYVDKADAICRQAQTDFKPVDKEMFESFPPSLQRWAEGLPKMTAIFRPATDKLRALTPPAGDEAAVTKIWDARSKLLDELDQGAIVAKTGDSDKFQEVGGEFFPAFDKIDGMERAYGFQYCGSEDEGES